jgi:cardiolipin synthase (CMP-forming)
MGSNWTIPNLLTILRILITPVFVIAFVNDQIMLALWLFLLAGVTDGLDGFLARLLKQRSRLGKVIDPLADKALLVTAFITLGVKGWLPNWLVILVVSRDLIILSGLALLHFLSVSISKTSPAVISKVNTVAQILLVFVVILTGAMGWEAEMLQMLLIGSVAVLTVVSGVYYVAKGFSLFPNVQE